MSVKCELSVVLCTWNNAERLAETLANLARCREVNASWELVVVANACTDDTADVARSFIGSLPLRLVEEDRLGLSNARNAGVAAAKGDLLVFTDDDVCPDTEWLVAYLEAYRRHPDGFFFGGPVTSDFERPPNDPAILKLAPWSVRGLSYGDEVRVIPHPRRFLAANWACARRDLDQVGAFDSGLGLVGDERTATMTGEESDLMTRLRAAGVEALYLPTAHLRHYVPAEKLSPGHLLSRGRAVGRYRALESLAGSEGPASQLRHVAHHALQVLRSLAAVVLAVSTNRDSLARRYRFAVAVGGFRGCLGAVSSTWVERRGR